MRTVPASISSDIASGASHLVGCWQITRTDGEVLRSTEFDQDIVIASGDYAGTYASTTSITGSASANRDDLSVDNMEASGTLDADFVINGILVTDIESGLLDAAEAVYFLVNWADPDGGQVVQRYGTLGNIQHDSTGRWTCELRGLTQHFQQMLGESFSLDCKAAFGDSRCKLNRDDYQVPGTVVSVSTNRTFVVSAGLGSPPLDSSFFAGGEVRFDTGLNAGFSRAIKSFDGSVLTMWEAFPFDVAPDDEVTIWPDCPKTRDACKAYGNIVNFRGFPDMPGPDALAKLRFAPRGS